MESITEINLQALQADRDYQQSPQNWEELIFYFLLVDRFSDGREGEDSAPQGAAEDADEILRDKQLEAAWHEHSERRNGGNLSGLMSKLDYLQQLGITALWISPVFKQPAFEDSYHGYSIQNFLEIEPRLGTREELKELVRQAHQRGIYVILDIVVNHTGNVFTYDTPEVPWTGEVYPIKGFNAPSGKPEIPPNSQDGDAVRPRELQVPETFSRKGYITDWEHYPEYIEGDFFSLKNVSTGTGEGEDFHPSEALKIITECYKYWIAYADIDGFRLDTVKHMYPEATRYFATEIHEFAHTLGKNNFYIIGEITGGFDFAVEMQKRTGLDAALGLNRIPESLEQAAKGYGSFSDYFSVFSNSPYADEDENRWYRNNVITMFDDHDMVTQSEHHKARFCADAQTAPLLLNALCINIMTMGIPCIYYGTEQEFDGSGDHDKFIREAMFAGPFGAFRSSGKHYFNQGSFIYREFSKLAELRRSFLPLQYGRQYIREISYDGTAFYVLEKSGKKRFAGVYGWSRIYSSQEIVIAVNTDLEADHTVRISIDVELHGDSDTFRELYRSDGKDLSVFGIEAFEDRRAVQIRVPAHGCVILGNSES